MNNLKNIAQTYGSLNVKKNMKKAISSNLKQNTAKKLTAKF